MATVLYSYLIHAHTSTGTIRWMMFGGSDAHLLESRNKWCLGWSNWGRRMYALTEFLNLVIVSPLFIALWLILQLTHRGSCIIH